MTNVKAWAIPICVIAALLASTTARADNTACAGAIILVPDGSPKTGTLLAAAEKRWFRFVAKADRSYAVMLDNLSPADGPGPVLGLEIPSVSCGGTTLFIHGITDTEPAGHDGTNGSGRYALKISADTNVFFSVFSIPSAAAAGAQFSIRVQDTTQINTFFSTFSGYNTFYRFTNTTNTTASVTLKLVSDGGAVVATSTFTVQPNSSAPTRNTSAGDLNVPPNTAGFAVITHDVTPNGVAADAFLSNGTSVLPLKIVDARQGR
jgi:hypothetical protein